MFSIVDYKEDNIDRNIVRTRWYFMACDYGMITKSWGWRPRPKWYRPKMI